MLKEDCIPCDQALRRPGRHSAHGSVRDEDGRVCLGEGEEVCQFKCNNGNNDDEYLYSALSHKSSVHFIIALDK